MVSDTEAHLISFISDCSLPRVFLSRLAKPLFQEINAVLLKKIWHLQLVFFIYSLLRHWCPIRGLKNPTNASWSSLGRKNTRFKEMVWWRSFNQRKDQRKCRNSEIQESLHSHEVITEQILKKTARSKSVRLVSSRRIKDQNRQVWP